MSLENELSYEEMKQIRITELSNLIVEIYNNANQQITFLKEPSIKLKWKYAEINAKKHDYLIFLEKYMNGDKTVFTLLRNYLVEYYEGKVGEKNGFEQIKLYSEQQKISLFKYATISAVLFSFIIPLIAIPAIAISIVYIKKSSNLTKRCKEIELDMAFKEATIEDLKELKESDLELALRQSEDKFKK